MKHKAFFYLQYNKLNWEDQEKTKINSLVNRFIIQNIILKKKGNRIKIFDIGFGIGFFLKMLYKNINKHYKDIIIEGCEPSNRNFKYFKFHPQSVRRGVQLRAYNKTFQKVQTREIFDFITAIYVFPHFESDELEKIVRKIYYMLSKKGKFVLVVANERYLKEKLKSQRDLFIEKNIITLGRRKYEEILHYSKLPRIGTIIDYNREERYYTDLFKKYHFELVQKKNLDDNGFICTVFIFEKEN